VLEIGKRKPVCARHRAVDSAALSGAVHFVGAGQPRLLLLHEAVCRASRRAFSWVAGVAPVDVTGTTDPSRNTDQGV
jgi:hypothetical protein